MVRIAPPAIGARSILAFIFLARVIMLLMPNSPLRSPLKAFATAIFNGNAELVFGGFSR